MLFNKRGKKMESKKAQFYLMAAVIIIGIIVVLSGITNYIITSKNSPKIYDLSEEFKEEGTWVVDYGIYSSDPTAISRLMDNFSIYSEEKDRGSELVFAYGDNSKINVTTFTSIKSGEVSLVTGSEKFNVEGNPVKKKNETYFSNPGSSVTVRLFDQNYTFQLHQGENFFFVIAKNSTETDEIYVAEKPN
jgi:hypothetical protein